MQQLLPQCPQAAWASKSAVSPHKHHKTAFGNANAGGGFCLGTVLCAEHFRRIWSIPPWFRSLLAAPAGTPAPAPVAAPGHCLPVPPPLRPAAFAKPVRSACPALRWLPDPCRSPLTAFRSGTPLHPAGLWRNPPPPATPAAPPGKRAAWQNCPHTSHQ